MWYYVRNGERIGPDDLSVISGLIKEGVIEPETLVWKEGMADWVKASTTELNTQFDGSATPPAEGIATPPTVQPQATQLPTQAVPNYLVQSILVTLFCCLPLGIPAIVFSAQVNGKLQAGDVQGALDSSRKAKIFAWWSFGLGITYMVGYLLFVLLAVVAEA